MKYVANRPEPAYGEAGRSGPRSRQRLRVAMVVPPYFEVPPKAYGGVESVVADLTDALVNRGHDVILLGAGQANTTGRFVPVWPEPIPGRLGEPAPEVVYAAVVGRIIARLARDEGLDLVHDHTFAGPLNAPTYAALGLPTVVTMHGPVNDDFRQIYGSLRDYIHLVAISDRQRENAPDLPWAGRVHNATRVDTFPFQPHKGDYALFLGRFHPEKAPHLALDAAHAAGIPLILAGKCAEPIEKAYFEKEVRPRLTSTDQIFGVADAVAKRKLLAEARCLLFPVQWEEPFGMVMIEAMACGTPVVALRGGAVPEVVVDGVTGFVRDNPDELPEALRQVEHIEPAACRKHVEARFDIDSLGAGYEQVYRDILARRESLDTLDQLRREYADLDAALDHRYGRDRRRVRRAPAPGNCAQPAGRRPVGDSSRRTGAL